MSKTGLKISDFLIMISRAFQPQKKNSQKNTFEITQRFENTGISVNHERKKTY